MKDVYETPLCNTRITLLLRYCGSVREGVYMCRLIGLVISDIDAPEYVF